MLYQKLEAEGIDTKLKGEPEDEDQSHTKNEAFKHMSPEQKRLLVKS